MLLAIALLGCALGTLFADLLGSPFRARTMSGNLKGGRLFRACSSVRSRVVHLEMGSGNIAAVAWVLNPIAETAGTTLHNVDVALG